MRLLPDQAFFTSCYPEWLADVANLLVQDKSGATFGIYGRWGSGKSSACQALILPIYEQATKLETYVEVRIINAFELRCAENPINDALLQIKNSIKLRPKKDSSDSTKRIDSRALATVIAKPLVYIGGLWAQREGGIPKEITDMGTPAAEALIENSIVRVADSLRTPQGENPDLECDKLILFIDDLDRCEPRQALAFLSETTDSIAAINKNITVNTVISCDPDVLGKHAAEIFGVTYVEGLEAIAKYIHAPLSLPTGKTRKHSETIAKSIPGGNKLITIPLRLAAETSIGKVPIREILSALPQAYLWINRAITVFPEISTKGNIDHQVSSLCKAALWLSLASIALPGILRYAIGSGSDGLSLIPNLNKLESTPAGNDEVVKSFGTAITEAMRLRPDLADLGLVLIGSQFDPTTSARLTSVIGHYNS